MGKLIAIRHGQSTWNAENRFTGWVDVDLSEKGVQEAEKSGKLLQELNINFDISFTSYLKRAIDTLEIVLKVLGKDSKYTKAWELNERHYGALTGLNKVEMGEKLGKDKIYEFRRSWDIKPDPLSKNSPFHPTNIETYKRLSKNVIPDTESLKDTYTRVIEYYEKEIQKKLLNQNILISAHGNSIRALCKYLFKLDNDQISNLEIPTGNPLVIEFNEKSIISSCEYLDKDRAKNLLVF